MTAVSPLVIYAALAFGAVLAARSGAGRRLLDAALGRPPAGATPHPAGQVPLVPVYRVQPQGIGRATTEDLTDASLQMREELIARRDKAQARAAMLALLVSAGPAPGNAPPAGPPAD